jgi:hypothetical protein
VKRYTDTEKWESNYFASLDPDIKLIYLYILDRCDLSGVWKGNWAVAKVFTGSTRSVEEIKKLIGCVSISDFTGKEKFVELDGGKIWAVRFLKFQNPNGIGSNKPMVIGIRKKIEEYAGLRALISKVYGEEFFEGVSKNSNCDSEDKSEIVPEENDKKSQSTVVDTEPIEKKVSGGKTAKRIISETFSGDDAEQVLFAYKEYEEVRRKIKSPLTTEGQVKRLLNKLSGMTAVDWIRCLQAAGDNGWKSVYPENTGGGSPRMYQKPTNGIVEYSEPEEVEIGTGI